MSMTATALEVRLAEALREHLERGDEHSLHEAYEVARRALDEGLGLLDMASMLLRAWGAASRTNRDTPSAATFERFEAHTR
jgi:hypothetical protein